MSIRLLACIFKDQIDHVVWDSSGEKIVTVDIAGRIAVWQMRNIKVIPESLQFALLNTPTDEHLRLALRQFLSTYGTLGSSVLHVNWINDSSNCLTIVLGCTKWSPSSSGDPKVDRCSAILLWEQEGPSYADHSWRLISTRLVAGGFPTSVRVVHPTLDFPAKTQGDFGNDFDNVLDGQYFPAHVAMFGLSDGTMSREVVGYHEIMENCNITVKRHSDPAAGIFLDSGFANLEQPPPYLADLVEITSAEVRHGAAHANKEIAEQLTERPSPITLLSHTGTRRNLIQILLLMYFARTSIREYQNADNSRLELLQAEWARARDELTVRKHMAVIREDLNRLRSVEQTLNRSSLQFELFGRILVDFDGHVSRGESAEEEETTGDCDWWWESLAREGSEEAEKESWREPLESTRQLVNSVRVRVQDEARMFIHGTLPRGYEQAVAFLRRKVESSMTQLFTEPSVDAGAVSGPKELSTLAMLGNVDTEWLGLRRMQEVPAANLNTLRASARKARLEYLKAVHANGSTNDFYNPTMRQLHAQDIEERNRFFERMNLVDEAILIRSHHDVITKRNLDYQNAVRQCTKCFHMSASRQSYAPCTGQPGDSDLLSPNGIASDNDRRDHDISWIDEVLSRREIITSDRRKKVRDHTDEVVAATSTFDGDMTNGDVFDWERCGPNGTIAKAGTFQSEKVSWTRPPKPASFSLQKAASSICNRALVKIGTRTFNVSHRRTINNVKYNPTIKRSIQCAISYFDFATYRSEPEQRSPPDIRVKTEAKHIN
ncbi:hypothetical protein BJ742DRAFT_734784 [Cladochytrium replicatum]|nr:hypothetical protein BJ742DRAFT_734784 [Cladochytrium replicatum]